MKIYETREEAYAEAVKFKKEVNGYDIDEGQIEFCRMKDGKYVETVVKMLQVGYEKHDPIEGWMDCCASFLYKN